MSGGPATPVSVPLTSADKGKLFFNMLTAFTGLIPYLTRIHGGWKLAIVAIAVAMFAITLAVFWEIWKRAVRQFPWLIGLIAGLAAGFAVGALALPHDISRVPVPVRQPPADAVTALMNEEIAATLDPSIVRLIYGPDAVVEDAACQPRGRARTWTGPDQILTRYQGLLRFASLQHAGAEIQLQPASSLADNATATAQTVGEMVSASGSVSHVYGKEMWNFTRLADGSWVITSFVYHIC